MFGVGSATRIYLAVGAADMRKGFSGRVGVVRDRLMCSLKSLAGSSGGAASSITTLYPALCEHLGGCPAGSLRSDDADVIDFRRAYHLQHR
jgi:hypothetical protein